MAHAPHDPNLDIEAYERYMTQDEYDQYIKDMYEEYLDDLYQQHIQNQNADS